MVCGNPAATRFPRKALWLQETNKLHLLTYLLTYLIIIIRTLVTRAVSANILNLPHASTWRLFAPPIEDFLDTHTARVMNSIITLIVARVSL